MSAAAAIAQLSAADLAAWRADPTRPAPLILDVREPWELAICRFEGATAIPLGQLPHRLGEIAASRPVVCVCHHGARSQHAAMLLNHVGRTEVFNLRGGVAAWAETVDPAMARY